MVIGQPGCPTAMGILLGGFLRLDTEASQSVAAALVAIIRRENPRHTIRASARAHFDSVEPDYP